MLLLPQDPYADVVHWTLKSCHQLEVSRLPDSRHCFSELSPVCAIVGGVLGQEIIKVSCSLLISYLHSSASSLSAFLLMCASCCRLSRPKTGHITTAFSMMVFRTLELLNPSHHEPYHLTSTDHSLHVVYIANIAFDSAHVLINRYVRMNKIICADAGCSLMCVK